MNVFNTEKYMQYLKEFYNSPYDKDKNRDEYIDKYGKEYFESIVNNTREFCYYLVKYFEETNEKYHNFELMYFNLIHTGLVGGHSPDFLYYFEDFSEEKAVSRYLLSKMLNEPISFSCETLEFYNEEEQMGHNEDIYIVEIKMDDKKLTELKDKLSKEDIENDYTIDG